ncbi:helix-turn-helix transcriptional regulator [Pseudoruegeria sp. HB172150]|uniref:helix-turn-helix domain-containing protein n=1 Tax=Pseudoruegeria sp. HB172150 TaxID=2721164 RepID=UPI001551D8A6
MSVLYHVTGRQLAAGRVLAGFSQEKVAKDANVSIATLRRIEASYGIPSALPNNVDAVKRAIEGLGIDFTFDQQGREGVKVNARGIARPPQ